MERFLAPHFPPSEPAISSVKGIIALLTLYRLARAQRERAPEFSVFADERGNRTQLGQLVPRERVKLLTLKKEQSTQLCVGAAKTEQTV